VKAAKAPVLADRYRLDWRFFVRKQLAKGLGILKVAKSLGIGTGTVQRIAKERANEPARGAAMTSGRLAPRSLRFFGNALVA
jgi:hypothetical protein